MVLSGLVVVVLGVVASLFMRKRVTAYDHDLKDKVKRGFIGTLFHRNPSWDRAPVEKIIGVTFIVGICIAVVAGTLSAGAYADFPEAVLEAGTLADESSLTAKYDPSNGEVFYAQEGNVLTQKDIVKGAVIRITEIPAGESAHYEILGQYPRNWVTRFGTVNESGTPLITGYTFYIPADVKD